MDNLYVTKKCGNCGKLTKINSEEYKKKLAKGNWESSEYIKLSEFLFINIDCCTNCGYCSPDIEKKQKEKFTLTEQQQIIQKDLKLIENKSTIYTYLFGGYNLIVNEDFFNAAKAFAYFAEHCCALFPINKSNTYSIEQHNQILESYKKVKKSVWQTATTLASDCYAKTSNLDALVLLLYILKESEQEEQYNTLSELIFTLPLSPQQIELAKIITEQNQ